MAGLTKKKLEIKNQTLERYIKAAVCMLDDQTVETVRKVACTAGFLSTAIEIANIRVVEERVISMQIWRIRYADGTVGYRLWEKEDAIKDAERKKDLYGGSYTIEEVE